MRCLGYLIHAYPWVLFSTHSSAYPLTIPLILSPCLSLSVIPSANPPCLFYSVPLSLSPVLSPFSLCPYLSPFLLPLSLSHPVSTISVSVFCVLFPVYMLLWPSPTPSLVSVPVSVPVLVLTCHHDGVSGIPGHDMVVGEGGGCW